MVRQRSEAPARSFRTSSCATWACPATWMALRWRAPADRVVLGGAPPCRADPKLRSARLIAVSGYSAPEDHARARSAGFERLLPKPLTRESLASLLSPA